MLFAEAQVVVERDRSRPWTVYFESAVVLCTRRNLCWIDSTDTGLQENRTLKERLCNLQFDGYAPHNMSAKSQVSIVC